MYLGIDVGSISIKFALFVPPGNEILPADVVATFENPEAIRLPGGALAYVLSYDRLLGDPNRKCPERLRH